MSTKIKRIIFCIAIPLIIGGISGAITMGSMETFDKLNKPVLSPPGFIFPIVWSILFILMGIASYLVLSSDKSTQSKKVALSVYAIQLFVNFFWSIFFFNFELYLFSFIWLILLWLLIIITTVLFFGINKTAGYLLVPYLLWVTFAAYLNLSIYLLN